MYRTLLAVLILGGLTSNAQAYDWIYNPDTGHHYTKTEMGRTWLQSRTEAAAIGAYITSIGTAEEDQWLFDTFSAHGHFWIGLADADFDGTWEWESGEAVVYDHWATPGIPNTDVYLDNVYGMLDENTGHWANEDDTHAANRFAVLEMESPPPSGADPIQWPISQGGTGHYYEVRELPGLTWNEANGYAMGLTHLGLRGHLATITTAEEDTWLRATFFDGEQSFYFGGYQPSGSPEPDGGWTWVTGEAWTFWGFATSEPTDTGGNEDCVGGWFASGWNDAECGGGSAAFIVEYDAILPAVAWTTSPHTGKAYGLNQIHGTWEQAWHTANAMGVELASIPDASENAWIHTTFPDLYFIGLNDIDSEGDWEWSSGAGVAYLNWAPNEPNNANSGEDAVEFQGHLSGKWNDASVHLSRWALLERSSSVVYTAHPLPAPDTGALSRGAAWSDHDQDGDDDLYLTRRSLPNQLLVNDGTGQFTEATPPALADPGDGIASIWFDIDNDRKLDLLTANKDQENTTVWWFPDFGYLDASGPPLNTLGPNRGPAVADFDLDGDLDVYFPQTDDTPNRLLRNDGPGVSFTDVTVPPLGDASSTVAARWCDYDADGDPDLYILNFNAPNRLLRNDGPSGFVDVTAGPLGRSGPARSLSWGDYDNDGLMDLCLTYAGETNSLLRNVGSDVFVDVTPAELTSTDDSGDPVWLDYDNDGWRDLFVAGAPGENSLLRNEAGNFVATANLKLGAADNHTSIATSDFDNDGDVDLFLANFDATPGVLARNDQATSNHWLQIVPYGVQGNTFGIGLRLELHAGGMLQVREVTAGDGAKSQHSLVQHFGLGGVASVDSVVALWPSGVRQTIQTPAVDQRIMVIEGLGTTTGAPEIPAVAALSPPYPNPFNPSTTIEFEIPQAGEVQIRILDLAGRRVRDLSSGHRPAGQGSVVWDGTDDQGHTVASGVYLVRMEHAGSVHTTRAVLLK